MIKNDGLKGLYSVVRSGLVHEYFLKNRSTIVVHNKSLRACGVVYKRGGTPKFIFIVEKYFDDFLMAFDKYEIVLKSSPSLIQKFNDALVSVNSILGL